jgi:hypothetical protein
VDGAPAAGADGYGRTNDARLYRYEWDADAGSYRIWLDYVRNGAIVYSDPVATVHSDGRCERYGGGDPDPPASPGLYFDVLARPGAYCPRCADARRAGRGGERRE